jgi:hypothetical protein
MRSVRTHFLPPLRTVTKRGPAPRHTGRARKRRHRRLWVVQRALLALVAASKLAGQSPTFRRSTPKRAFARLVKASFRLAKAFPFTQIHSHSSNSDDYDLPPWATRLYLATNLVRSVPISRAWSQFVTDSQSYAARCSHRRGNQTAPPAPPPGPGGTPPKLAAFAASMQGLASCGYATSNVADPTLVVPIDAKLASLPPAPHRPQHIGRFLGWPWSEIFSEDSVEHHLLEPSPARSPTAINMYDSFASEQDRSDLYLAMQARGMMEF